MSIGSTSAIIFNSLEHIVISSSMANPTNNATLGLNNRIGGKIEDYPRHEDVGSQNGENMNYRNNINSFDPVEEELRHLHDLLQPDCITTPLYLHAVMCRNSKIQEKNKISNFGPVQT